MSTEHVRELRPIETETDSFEAAGIVLDAILQQGDVPLQDGRLDGVPLKDGDLIEIAPTHIARDSDGFAYEVSATETVTSGSDAPSEPRILAFS
jgi:hypothetical protein